MVTQVTYQTITPVVPRRSGSVACFIGTSTAGSKDASFLVPETVNSFAEATEAFGTSGTIIDAFRRYYERTRARGIGILYDGSKSGAALTTELQNAIDAIAATGDVPNVVAAGGVFRNSTNDGAANALLTRAKAITKNNDMILPADTDDASITVAKTYADANKDIGVVLVYPKVNTANTTGLDGSVALACELVANDSDPAYGIQRSPTNIPIPDITGATPEVTFSYQDATRQAGDLDSKGITSFPVADGRRVVWGGQTDYASTDPRKYVGVYRIAADIARYDIKQPQNRILGANGSQGLLRKTADQATGRLQTRRSLGQIAFGRCTPRPGITDAMLLAGHTAYNCRVGVYIPIRRIDTTIETEVAILNFSV